MKWTNKLILAIAISFSVFGKNAVASDQNLYDFLWLDPDKSVYVLQNKFFEKKKMFFGSVGFNLGVGNEFQSVKGLNGAFGYYFNELFSVQLFYNHYSNKDNQTLENVQRVNGVTPFIRRFDAEYGAILSYYPFYGKINTFNKIIYFDWYFGLGVSQLKGESNAITAQDENIDRYDKESFVGAVVKTGVKVYATKKIQLGFDYTKTYYNGNGPERSDGSSEKSLSTKDDLVFSVGFSF